MNLQETAMAADVLRPGDDGYDDAARVFFATGRPAMVVRPRDPDEVAAAVRDAVRHDLAVSVRSGGHSALGHGTNTDGMVSTSRTWTRSTSSTPIGAWCASAAAPPGARWPRRSTRTGGA